ncbi:hypothetical protein, partial [Ralstonia solanacearum]|uniref:hypothetical protein n=2 Tax=Ralstonia solanacearum TaxID=305 RepID=UPI0018B0E2FE
GAGEPVAGRIVFITVGLALRFQPSMEVVVIAFALAKEEVLQMCRSIEFGHALTSPNVGDKRKQPRRKTGTAGCAGLIGKRRKERADIRKLNNLNISPDDEMNILSY